MTQEQMEAEARAAELAWIERVESGLLQEFAGNVARYQAMRDVFPDVADAWQRAFRHAQAQSAARVAAARQRLAGQ